ncbi:MAG: hypothetical protein MdMp024_1415 [Bacteroidales bacterium]
MKTNIEKVLSFLIELARLFLAWKKGGNRVWGMGYRVWGKTQKAGRKNPLTAKNRVWGTGYGVWGEKTPETESKTPESGRKKPPTADAENPHTPEKGDGEWWMVDGEEKNLLSHHTPTPIPQPPKNSDSVSADADDANSGIPGGDGDSAGSNGGAAVATGEKGYGEWGIVDGEDTPTPIPQDIPHHTPSPNPHTPLKLLGWGLMLYAGIRLLSRF